MDCQSSKLKRRSFIDWVTRKPTISLSASLSSPTLVRSDTADPFIITVTATVNHTWRPITVLTRNTFFAERRCHWLLNFTDTVTFIQAGYVERVMGQICALRGKGKGKGIPLTQKYQSHFITISPQQPYTFEIYIGPLQENRPYVLKKLPDRKLNWGRGDILQAGRKYKVGLEKCHITWWSYGPKEQVLRDNRGSRNGLLIWKERYASTRRRWNQISLELKDGPTFNVVGANVDQDVAFCHFKSFEIPEDCFASDKSPIARMGYTMWR